MLRCTGLERPETLAAHALYRRFSDCFLCCFVLLLQSQSWEIAFQGAKVSLDRAFLGKVFGKCTLHRLKLLHVVGKVVGIPESGFCLTAPKLGNTALLFCFFCCVMLFHLSLFLDTNSCFFATGRPCYALYIP
jgi:hypothetical protein